VKNRKVESISRYPTDPLETPYFPPFLESGETSLVTGFSNKKSPDHRTLQGRSPAKTTQIRDAMRVMSPETRTRNNSKDSAIFWHGGNPQYVSGDGPVVYHG
jgi:hypothetical protein